MPDPIAEPAACAQALLASLDPHVADEETAWGIELRRRIDELDGGQVRERASRAAVHPALLGCA